MDVINQGVGERLVPYREAWDMQRVLHEEVAAGDRDDTLLVLEHPETFTAGRSTRAEDRPRGDTPVVDVDRGGKVTWHGPGQLVGYPIFRLTKGDGVVDHVRRIEAGLRHVLRAVGVDAHLVSGRSGLWVPGAICDDKVAAIGVRVTRGVSMHGFAVNCANDLTGFSRITPCGITDAGVTTLSLAAGRPIAPADLVPHIASRFLPGYVGGPLGAAAEASESDGSVVHA